MCLIVFELPDGSSSLGPRFTDPVLCLWSSPAFVCSAPPAMSHHQYRRRPMPDTDFRPSPGPDGLSERHRRSSPDRRGYYGSESGSSTSAPALPLSSMDSALSVLSSCGLEPADLALLAEIPEDKLTVESLPHIVRQIKSNREAPDPPPVSSFDLPSLPVERWHQYSGRVVEYPLDHIKPTGLPAEPLREWRDCWQNPRSEPTPSQTQRPARSEPPSQSPRYFAEAGPGKAAAATIPSLFSLAHRPSPADRSVAPPDERRWETGSERGHPDASASQPPSAAAPSKQEVQDFYSVEPQTYPTSCSLCNACVISLEDWRKHINSSRHADGQLGLLHRFPTWDCRKETPNRAERQSQVGLGARRRKDPETFWATNDGSRWQAGKSPEKKPVAESKSAEQARESVAIHKRRPPYVDEQRVEFSISNVFNIVKSSCVVSFTPPPQSNEDWSDLLRVVRRFGPIVYTLFGRSKACVEMKNLEDAEKLVNYYSSKHLRIKDNVLRVTFAVETSSLRTSAFAQRYQDESTERSRDEGRTLDESKKSRADHTARFRKARETDRKARSRSKSKSRDRKARSTSRERKTGSKDRSKSRDRKIRSRSRDRKARSKSSSSSAKMPEAQKPEMSGKKKNNNNKRRILTGPFIPNKLSVSLNHRLSSSTASSGASASLKLSEADAVDRVLSNMDADSVEDDSDIEGMAVVGEDLEDDRLETADEGHQKGEDCKTHGANKTENTSDEEVDLEDYIMLDEVGQEQSSKVVEPSRDCAAGEGGHGPQVSRVVYFKDLPLSYCNAADFVKLAKGLGRPVCYYLLRGLRKGFLELSCSSEAIRVVNELNVYFKDTPTVVLISNKYRRLRNGTAVHWDQRETGERTGASDRRDKSKSRDKEGRRASSASDQEKEKPAREKDFTRKTPDKESTSSSSSDILSSSKCGNSKDVQSPSGKTEIKAESEKTEESQPEGMVPETPEDKPNTSDARTSDSKTTKNIADGKKTFGNKPDSENTHNVQTKVTKTPQNKSGSENQSDSEKTLENKPETSSEVPRFSCVILGHQKGEDCKAHGANKTEDTSDEEVDLEDYIMLDEVGQEQSSKVVEPSRDCAAGEGGHGPVSRVVYFKDLPLSYCNAADFVKLAKGLGRPVCYYLLRGLRKGFLELSCSSEAIRVVNELNVYFKDTPTVVLISNKYRRLRNGTAVHWDQRETGERTGASGRRDKSKSRDKEGRRASSASDQEKEKPAREKDFTRKTPDKESTSSSSSDILSSSKCENSKDVQSPSGKTQTKAESEKTEESQPEGMVPETPEDKPNTSDARTSDSKTTKNIADGKKTFEDKPDSENIHNVQTKVVEDKPQKGKSSSAQSNDSETTKNILEGKKTFENKLDSKNTHNVQTIVTKTPQNRSEGENLHNVKSKENKWDSEKNQAENASEGGNTHNEQPKDGKALQNLEGGKRLRNQPDNEMTLETLSEEGKITEVGTESKKTLEIVQIESEGGNGPKTRKRTIEKSESEKIKRRCVSTKTCEEGQVESGKAVGTTQKKCGENPERGSVSSKGSDQVSGKDPKVTNSPQEDPSGEEDLGGTVKRRASPDDTSAAGKIRKEEQSSETSDENQKNQEADGNSGAPTAPLHPIGIQFVRPVVGYFCNLCQLIYADEDEAKVQHCSSRQHHFNYWEKMKMAT
ncbi:uncharacterized protein [Syngnathus scovelli]|uniref:uncharacterized protein isoform X2 n=1 Tax=Syngnathus scovelli TaxID=161590 RepID=UPI00210F3236|nr:uncharacterized protein LOC125967804 isoform X2 [Syngnathus scovelli]